LLHLDDAFTLRGLARIFERIPAYAVFTTKVTIHCTL
jgi:hypothetical protein